MRRHGGRLICATANFRTGAAAPISANAWLDDASARGPSHAPVSEPQRLAPARAMLIAGAIGIAAILALSAPARARAAAPSPRETTCANQLLTGGSYDDVSVTPGHW